MPLNVAPNFVIQKKSELILSIQKKKNVREIIRLPTYLLHFYSTVSFTVDEIMKVGVPETDAIKKCEFKKGKILIYKILWQTSLEHILLICQRLVICTFTY